MSLDQHIENRDTEDMQCDICGVIIEWKDENFVYGCDFCESLLCDTCQDREFINYYKCDECQTKHCYYDGLHWDGYCSENTTRRCMCD